MFRNDASARNRLALIGVLGAVMLGSFGCATQTWTVETIREMDKELVARMAKIEATAAAEKIRVDGQLNEIRGIGVDARNRADAVNARLTQAQASRLKRAQVQTLDVTFETGKSDISQSDRAALQALLPTIKDNPAYTVDVVGYTDTVGDGACAAAGATIARSATAASANPNNPRTLPIITSLRSVGSPWDLLLTSAASTLTLRPDPHASSHARLGPR